MKLKNECEPVLGIVRDHAGIIYPKIHISRKILILFLRVTASFVPAKYLYYN